MIKETFKILKNIKGPTRSEKNADQSDFGSARTADEITGQIKGRKKNLQADFGSCRFFFCDL